MENSQGENNKDPMSKEYDVIVIGSGAGGLTAAVALAQAGKSVLVLEQHEVPGRLDALFYPQRLSLQPRRALYRRPAAGRAICAASTKGWACRRTWNSAS